MYAVWQLALPADIQRPEELSEAGIGVLEAVAKGEMARRALLVMLPLDRKS